MKQHSGKQKNQFGKMAMLERWFEPVFKKSAQSPVGNRYEIPAQVAGFGAWYFFLPFPPGATQCRVSFVQGTELGLGVTEAQTILDFLKQQQRALYFPRFVLQEALVTRLSPTGNQRLRHCWLELPLAFSSSSPSCFLHSWRISSPTSGCLIRYQCTETKQGHNLDLVAVQERAHPSLHTGKDL